MNTLETKICIICGEVFEKPKGCGQKFWDRRKMCSLECRKIFMKKNHIGFKKGHRGYLNSGNFKKGQNAWNKGLPQVLGSGRPFKKGFPSPYKGKSRGYTPEIIEKIKIARARQISPSGKNHWNWKGGTSELRKRLQETNLYRKWRTAVFERDNYTCQKCGTRGGKLNADHIKSYSSIISENKITTVVQAKKCSVLWDVLNGRTLCESCHQKTDTYGGKSIS